MKYIVPEEINTVFYDSFKYLEEIENLILGGRYSNVDFERINVLYDTRKLHRNPELQYIHQLISELSYGQNTSNLVQQIERQTAKIITLYREYHQTIFMVDDEFAYAHLSEAILHALLVGLDKIKNPLKLASVAELIKIEGPVIHGILPNLKNQFIFQMSHNIFKDLDVKCNNIHTTYKSKTLKILNFLGQTKTFSIGDTVGTMDSQWRETRTNKKRWTRGNWKVLIEGKGGCSHFCDMNTEGVCIYMNSGFTGSRTVQYEYQDKKWVPVKELTNLIR